MFFALTAYDKPDSLQLRMATRTDHLAYLEDLKNKGTLKLAGPFLDAEGKPNGSLVVIEADDMATARTIVAGDPYARAGLFETTDLRAWNWVFCKPE